MAPDARLDGASHFEPRPLVPLLPQGASALPAGVLWIPVWLSALFLLVSAWTWRSISPGLQNLPRVLSSAVHSASVQTASAAVVEDTGSLEVDLPRLDELSPVFTPEVQVWAPAIQAWARSAGLDPNLVATVMQIESCGHPWIRSSAGAIGLFQVMPYHFLPGEDGADPDTNALRGLHYLSRALELADGDFALALAGYNGGHGVIGQDPSLWPDETRRYVRWGAGIMNDIRSGSRTSDTLSAWLQAGGESLCARAAQAIGTAPGALP